MAWSASPGSDGRPSSASHWRAPRPTALPWSCRLPFGEIAPLEVGSEDGGIERLAGGAPQQLGRAPARGLAVDMLGEPGQQRLEIATTDRRRDLRLSARGRVIELGRGHGAEGIGGEIAPGTDEPVD